MTTSQSEQMFSSWLKQWTDPTAWQNWVTSLPNLFPQMMQAMPMNQGMGQPLNFVDNAFLGLLKEAGAQIEPETLSKLQADYMQQFATLWQDVLQSKAPQVSDKRFSNKAWQENAVNAFNAASYLLNARYMREMAHAMQAPDKLKNKIEFAVEQVVDAMSPANFFVTNPEAQQKLIETRGESLTKGIANMLADMQKGRISQSDESAFEVGVNVATAPGQVVFENDMLQLIQYQAATSTVHQVPLLIVPPCINKFYILDLQPENSLVRYAVEQGHTVFLISWRNPDQTMREITWDDYIEKAALEAIRVVQEISGQEKINAFGFCVGGTIIATALAVLAARGQQVGNSLTLLTTFLDFEDAGILEVFVDETQVKMREQALAGGGLMPGRDLAATFSSLRPNDLVWNYVQSNYLKGDEPPPFDLLYWNGDSTNLPGPMFCWYLRNTYLENNLKVPGKLTVAGEKVDLGKIDAPVFVYGSKEDHIVPWGAAFASLALLNPEQPERNRFVLGASGHIAGVINSPAKKKRNYWSNDQGAKDKASWMQGATEHAGSWWPEWAKFLHENGGKQIKAPKLPGKGKYKAIEPAPGRYVKVRGD